jgi:2-polyprenyl-3-methyl-5-hydroxy-6-metoxy-1,4-benzoquinol methylase
MKRPIFNPLWNEDVKTLYANDLREMWDPSIELQTYYLYQNQLNFYFSIVDAFNPKSILDVGCAQATLATLLAEQGKRVCALDIRSHFVDYAKSRYEKGDISFLCANIMDGPDIGHYDLVFANQIIEHLVYPVSFLKLLKGYLNPEGILVITTPNYHYFRNNLPSYSDLGDPSRYENRQFSAGGGDHFFAYSEEELTHFFQESGLEVLDVQFFETPWISGHFKVRFIQKIFPFKVLRLADHVTLTITKRWLAHQLCVIGKSSG